MSSTAQATTYHRGDPVVFTADDHDGIHLMPKGTRGVYDDFEQQMDSTSVSRVLLEDGTRVTAWTERLAPAPAAETTDVVIHHTSHLRVGDVVTQEETSEAYPHVARPVPPKAPEPPKVGYGMATAAGARRKGFASKSGHFYYLDADNDQRTAYRGHWTNFVPEEG